MLLVFKHTVKPQRQWHKINLVSFKQRERPNRGKAGVLWGRARLKKKNFTLTFLTRTCHENIRSTERSQGKHECIRRNTHKQFPGPGCSAVCKVLAADGMPFTTVGPPHLGCGTRENKKQTKTLRDTSMFQPVPRRQWGPLSEASQWPSLLPGVAVTHTPPPAAPRFPSPTPAQQQSVSREESSFPRPTDLGFKSEFDKESKVNTSFCIYFVLKEKRN